MEVWAYIDGFNLYNGCLKGTPYKWLNLQLFCEKLLPGDSIAHIKYFTAQVDSRVNDPGQKYRQLRYWSALRSLPSVEIIQGHFLSKKALMPTAASVDRIAKQARSGRDVSNTRPKMVEVYRSEEKGTDVNLAAHLIHDGHMQRFEAALVVSNDSDLTESIRIVRREVGKVVGVFNPHRERPSVQLKNTASFFRRIQPRHLRESQFPAIVPFGTKKVSKPAGW